MKIVPRKKIDIERTLQGRKSSAKSADKEPEVPSRMNTSHSPQNNQSLSGHFHIGTFNFAGVHMQ